MIDERALYVPDGDGFVGTMLTQGTWDPRMQTGASVLALLGHCLEDVPTLAPMAVSRLTFDLVRPVPIGVRLDVRSELVRQGKKLQLVQLDLRSGEVLLVRATALRLRLEDFGCAGPTLGAEAQSDEVPLPVPESCERMGGAPTSPRFLEAIELRRAAGLGTWVRLAASVVAGVPVRETSHVAVALDFTHLVNADIQRALPVLTIINPDVSAHLLRRPQPGWIGITGYTSFETATGRGMSSAAVWDQHGRVGVASTSALLQRRPTSREGNR